MTSWLRTSRKPPMANSNRQQNAEWHESFHATKLRINENRPTLIMMQEITTKAGLPSNVDSYLYCYWCWLGDIRTITPFVQHREMFISSKPELQPRLRPQQRAMRVRTLFSGFQLMNPLASDHLWQVECVCGEGGGDTMAYATHEHTL